MKLSEVTKETFNKYDAQEFVKAMLKGTEAAWRTYRRNMKKAKAQIEKQYDAEMKALIYG